MLNTRNTRGTSPIPDAFVIDDDEGICSFVSMTLGTLGLISQSFHVAADAVAALGEGIIENPHDLT